MRRLYLLIIIIISIKTCTPIEKETTSFTYLALGDSYTIGESVDSNLRYPVQISDTLNLLGYKTKSPEIIAVTGWTTGNLKNGIEAVDPQGPYDLVSLLIGVNNQYQGLDINLYKTEFRELLEQAVAFADDKKEKVIVLSIPDYGVTPFASGSNKEKIANEIDQYNAINREISMEMGVVWIDVTAISRMAQEDGALIAGDGLHPSAKMYSEWVKVALPHVINILDLK